MKPKPRPKRRDSRLRRLRDSLPKPLLRQKRSV